MSQPFGFVFGNQSTNTYSRIEFASGFLEAFEKKRNLIDAEDGVAYLELHHPSFQAAAGTDACHAVPGEGGNVLESSLGDGNDEGEVDSPTPHRETRRRKCPDAFTPSEGRGNRSVKKSRRSADTVTAMENSVPEDRTNKTSTTSPAPAKDHEDTPRPKVSRRAQVERGLIPSMMPPPVPRRQQNRSDGKKQRKGRRSHKDH